MFLADFHVHSQFSDGKLTIPQLVDLYGKLGFGAIAVTDHLCEENSLLGKAARLIGNSLTHESFDRYMETLAEQRERAWKEYRMVLISGVELTKNTVRNSRSAHILGIGIQGKLTADGDATTLARAIRAQGALAVAAHPVSTRKMEKQTYYLWDRREELASEFDAWEVASGPYLFDEVADSKLPLLASSDLHSPKQITAWKTVLHCERSEGAILDAVRKQDVDFRFFEEPNRVMSWVYENIGR